MLPESGCAVCGSRELEEIAEYAQLPRITSDCKPFAPGGRLRECRHCGAMQKVPTSQWREEIARIYAEYVPYHQAEGVEQIVLDSATGTLRRRSEVIVSRLGQHCKLPAQARALDVGCGSGATLRVMSREYPSWHLSGLELDARNHSHLFNIAGVKAVYDCPAAQIRDRFDLITSIHAVEHFDEPVALLRDLRSLAKPGAYMFIQTPNLLENPYDLVVADHFLHFSPATLARVVAAAGFEVLSVHSDWVSKENSLLARAGTPSPAVRVQDDRPHEARAKVRWLAQAADLARRRAQAAPSFGIFGTSIAATWFAAALGDAVDFFVDEDPVRQQQRFMGKPVLAPEAIPSGAQVLLALAPATAANVMRRLDPRHYAFVEPGAA